MHRHSDNQLGSRWTAQHRELVQTSSLFLSPFLLGSDFNFQQTEELPGSQDAVRLQPPSKKLHYHILILAIPIEGADRRRDSRELN